MLVAGCILAVLLVSTTTGFPEECGQKPDQPPWEPTIVGGRTAEAHSWPWQLSLQFLREDTEDDFRHTCGAVLIDEGWALCAAHCVEGRMVGMNDSRREDPENFRLVLGAQFHDDRDWTGTEIVHTMDLIIKHELWFPDPYHGYPNDIALLRLTEFVEDIEDNEHIELACVPQQQNMNFSQSECWITGWGKVHWQDDWIPDELQEAQVDALTVKECQDLNFGYIRDTHICAGYGMPNACSGDSGGPMSCRHEDKWYLAGITSWGVAFCAGVPAVYTRVSKYWEWIKVNQALNPHPQW